MNDIDRLLEDAGARWRAMQPAPPTIDGGMLLDRWPRTRRSWSFMAGAAGMFAVLVIASLLLDQGLLRGPGPQPPDGLVPGGALPSAATAPSPPGAATSAGRQACHVTKPVPVFVAPSPFPATPPVSYDGAWFGTEHLWTMLRTDGDFWVYQTPAPFPQKTFWWSVDWPHEVEQEPAISVTGTRLDGSGAFTFGNPGTNATADFGTAMLVGIDVPTGGCWQITGRYRDAVLPYVVWVEGD